MSLNPANAIPVLTVAALLAFPISIYSGAPIALGGYYAIGDGGEGILYPTDTSPGTVNNGTIFQVGTTYFVRQVSGPVLATWFGTKGDGSNNDKTAIQNALDTRKDVLLPPCLVSYKMLSGVHLYDGQTLSGSGQLSPINCAGTNANAVTMVGVTRATVKDLAIQYSGTYSSGLNGSAVAILAGSSFCKVRNCYLTAIVGGVTINSSDDNTVEDNIVEAVTVTVATDGSWDMGVYLNGSRNNFINNKCIGGSGQGIQVLAFGIGTVVNDNIVMGNYIANHTQYGVVVYQTSGTTLRTIVSNNRITNVTGAFDSGGGKGFGNGIYGAGAEYMVISNNNIDTCNQQTVVESLAPACIGLTAIGNATIIGNIVSNTTWYGIMVVGGNPVTGRVTITGNVLRNTTKSSIYVKNQDNVVVAANGVTLSGDAGIQVSAGSNNVGININGNDVGDCVGRGISVSNCAYPVISNNKVDSCAVGGFILINSGRIIGNTFTNSTGATDFQVDNTCTGIIYFAYNMVRGPAAINLNDLYGMTYGPNDVGGGVALYGTNGLERLLASSATPAVANIGLCTVGAGSNITDLTGGNPGQQITIRATANRTIVNNSGAADTRIILNAGGNFNMVANNTLTLYLPAPGSPWHEIGRA